MGIIFSRFEKFFDKKYRYNNYNYDTEYDSIVKNEENNEYELEDDAYAEDDVFIYDNKQAKIDYYNKKLEGILYIS
jgi:hypothetical protein